MKTYSKSRPYLSCIFLPLFVLILLLPVPVPAQSPSAAQSPRLFVNLSPTVLEIAVPDLRKTEVISVDVAGPDDIITHTESKESPVLLALDIGIADGPYRYEVHVVDQRSGTTADRVAGMFRVQYGQILIPTKGEGKRSEVILPWFKELLGHFADAASGFFISEAQAQDVMVSSQAPSLFFDDTDIVTTEWKAMASQVPYGVSCSTVPANLAFMDLQGGTRYVVTLCSSINNHRSLEVDLLGDIHFAGDGMFFDRSARYLGIGTTIPGYTLDTVGDRIRLRDSTAAGAKTIMMRTDGAAIDLEVQNGDLWIRSDAVAPARNIYMMSDKVGVGTSAPLYKFVVNGEGSNRSTLHFTNTGGDVGGWLTSVADNNFFVSSGAMWNGAGWVQKSPDLKAVMAGSGPSGYRVMTRFGCAVDTACSTPITRMMIDYAGNVGFGIPTPGIPAPVHPLHMASGAHVTAGGIWMNASSRKYKDHIEELALDDALKTIRNLNPVTFSYKADPSEKHVGFVAEDVPELVATKDREGLSPMDIVAVMTKVVQEQQNKIDNQNTMVQEQRVFIEKQQRALERQEKVIEDLAARLERLERAR